MTSRVYVLENTDEEEASIYLAGPTHRIGKKESEKRLSWRDDALEMLESKNFAGTVYIPEYRDNQPEEWTYSRQIDWELNAMAKSKVILFWIPRDLEKLPAFTTNIEFGEWMKSGKIVIGAPSDAPKNEYLMERCSRLEVKWYTTLQDCVSTAIQKAEAVIGEENKLWFTADTHFGHQRTLELSKRPFASLAEMDWQIVCRWNMVVGENDTVYHLGDFGNPEMIRYLKGKRIIFLPGNYDTPEIISALKQDERVEIIENNYPIVLQDFQLRLIHEPEKAEYHYFYLFGHIHKLQMVKENGLNVGVDCHHFSPISEEIVSFYHNAITKHYDQNVFLCKLGGKGFVLVERDIIEICKAMTDEENQPPQFTSDEAFRRILAILADVFMPTSSQNEQVG